MKNNIIIVSLASIFSFSLLAVSCKKDPAPVPDEQELITTLKMHVTNTSEAYDQTFVYKVENGFGNNTPGTVHIDTVKLKAGITYNVELEVLNEKADPVENITEEILEKRDEHIFVLGANASVGTATLTISNGNTDSKGLGLNQTFDMQAGTSANGQMDVVLLHDPVSKTGLTLDNIAGAETDLYAKYPLLIE